MDIACMRISVKDNVAVALKQLMKGEIVKEAGSEITLLSDIPERHKFALEDIAEGSPIIKFGEQVGRARKTIKRGAYVHVEEIETTLAGMVNYAFVPVSPKPFPMPEFRTFNGYLRDNGEVGVRNEIWIVNTVGCVNSTAKNLAKVANEKYGHLVDGIYAFPHVYGCSQLGDDLASSQRILSGMVNHPNAAGVLVLGLGCERNNIPEFRKVLGNVDETRVKFLVAQESEDEMEDGVALIGQLAEHAARFTRQEVPISKLKVGLKCGASDGYSGITANPLVGAFSDMLTSAGGTTVLTEISEMFGAEQVLMNRCADQHVFDKFVDMINASKDYFLKYGEPIDANPSPGNIAGGISTCEEKSMGCIQKGGSSKVTDVIDYGERSSVPGLNILSGPGEDVIAITALMASGCQVILFTTGNGNPLGAPVPTIKISSNTALYEKKRHWIDFDAGSLLAGASMQDLANMLYEFVLSIAQMDCKTLNEINGFRDIAMLKDGVTT